MAPKRTSISELAERLGVSKTLVSLVLNGKGDEFGIKEETQKKVLALAEELNYRPNQLARGLRLQKTQSIGLILSNISDPYYSHIARSVEDRAAEYGCNVLFSSSDENPEKELEDIQVFRDRRVDGLIISACQLNSDIILQLKKEHYPFVLIDRYFPNIKSNLVLFDNFGGAFKAVSHLLDLGFRQIGQLTICPHLHPIRERDRGYREALKQHGVQYTQQVIREVRVEHIQLDVATAYRRFFHVQGICQ